MGSFADELLCCFADELLKRDRILCYVAQVEVVLISPSQGWTVMSQVTVLGVCPPELEKRVCSGEGAQAPSEGACGYQQQSRNQS